ncbi:MAG: VCBS repeat-containing protein [Myxococcaceae bacterium]|nr:VCBS repeat-containing protein [Myxococcaceae bacterium]
MKRLRFLGGLLLVAACEQGGGAQSGGGAGGGPPMEDLCRDVPALTLKASPTKVHVNASATLEVTGGSGRTTFTLAAGGSGGEVRGGRLVTGPTPGTDTVTAADDCGHSAMVKVDVVGAFDVRPTRATVKPSSPGFQVEVTGKLGAPKFSGQAMASGGSISATGKYVPGATPGVDLIVVSDDATSEQVLVQYAVSTSAAFAGSPGELALPSGASVPLEVKDGSGEVTWTKKSGPGAVAAGVFSVEADAGGVAVLEGKDRFTGETATVRVKVLEELTRPTRPHGRLSDVASIVTGDFDGDGVADVALGVPESDLGRPQGGAVFIFKGSPGGLPDKPTWTITGDTDTAQLGAVMAAGDLDGDGKADLVISEPGADVTVADSGAVLLYRFDAEGPKLLRPPLTGLGRGNFGAALAVADVDGDGDRDLLVGSPGGDLAAAGAINSRGVLDVFLLTPGQPIPDLGTLRLGGADLAVDGTMKATGGLRFGRSLVVGDFNGDGHPDVAWLGAVNNTLLGGVPATRNQIAAAVHFGRAMTPVLADQPDLYLLPSNPADGNEGTWRLGLVPAVGGKPALLLLAADASDSPDLSADAGALGVKSGGNAGGVVLFDVSSLKPAGAPAAKPTQLGRAEAFARLWGDAAGIAAERSFAAVDVDGDGALELVLGAPYASGLAADGGSLTLGGRLLVYPLATLTPGVQVNKPKEFRAAPGKVDVLGVAVAEWKPGTAKGLVAFNARASSAGSDFTGRLDAFLGAGALSALTRTSAEVPAKVAAQQHGQCVELAPVAGAMRAAVGMPGYSGPGVQGDGNDVSAGQVLAYTQGQGGSPAVVAEGAGTAYVDNGVKAYAGRQVGLDVAFTDFDGDGLADLVVAAPNLSTPPASTTEFASVKAACAPATGQTNGGVLVRTAKADGTFRDGFRLWALADIPGCASPDGGTAPGCKRSGLARSGIAGGFDFDGDGKQDLAVTRSNGLEIFLGRAPDDAQYAKPSMGCDPAYSLPALVQATSAPAALGDLDGDGCQEVGARYSDGTRSGWLIVYGFDATGVRCMGHDQASVLRISGDPETGLNNMQLGVSGARVGNVRGGAKDFLAVSAALYPLQGVSQPVVLLFDLAELKAKRPAPGTSAVVGALNDGLTPIPLSYRERAPGFGRMVAGNVDVSGDGVADLVVSAPGASVNGDGTGAVFIFAGGPTLGGPSSPYLTLVGDGAERAAVGQDLFLSPGQGAVKPALGVGAPMSYRTGTANGTAWLLPLGN